MNAGGVLVPAHPQGQPHGGALLLLQDLPQAELVKLPLRLAGALFVGRLPGKARLEGGHGQAADPDRVGPVVELQLAEEVVPAQILQLHAGHPLLIQGAPGDAGHGLRPHGPPKFVGDHHVRGVYVLVLLAGGETGGGLLLQGDRPVLQEQAARLEVHLGPFQGHDLLPAEALQPVQPEDEPRQVLPVPPQKLAHIRFIRPAEPVSHGDLPVGKALFVILVLQITRTNGFSLKRKNCPFPASGRKRAADPAAASAAEKIQYLVSIIIITSLCLSQVVLCVN